MEYYKVSEKSINRYNVTIDKERLSFLSKDILNTAKNYQDELPIDISFFYFILSITNRLIYNDESAIQELFMLDFSLEEESLKSQLNEVEELMLNSSSKDTLETLASLKVYILSHIKICDYVNKLKELLNLTLVETIPLDNYHLIKKYPKFAK